MENFFPESCSKHVHINIIIIRIFTPLIIFSEKYDTRPVHYRQWWNNRTVQGFEKMGPKTVMSTEPYLQYSQSDRHPPHHQEGGEKKIC